MDSKVLFIMFVALLTFSIFRSDASNYSPIGSNPRSSPVPTQQVALDGNNINSWIINTGIFDQDLRVFNTPGFEYPKGMGSYAIFSTGLTVAARVNNQLLMSSGSYSGEYAPGHVVINGGVPTAVTDWTFHIYSVKRGDNQNNNPDWLYWGYMIPYGAPFIDVNHNGTYEPAIDTPGIRYAEQTIFLCMTDGFASEHGPGEGFGGGTLPLFNEVHVTAWCYNVLYLQDVQFLKWDIINKSTTPWNSTYISVVNDPDLGCADDDYIGCDTSRNLGFCYNAHDVDCSGTYRYPGIVPSVGIMWIKCSNQYRSLTSFDFFTNVSSGGPICERDPNPAGAENAYNYMKGFKSDGTPWVIPPGGQVNVTKFCYNGDPESGTGWCEAQSQISGSVQNCGGPNIFTGPIVSANTPGDRRMVLNTGSDNFTMNPGDTQKILISQIAALGSSRRNSVTMLKSRADYVKAFACGGFIVGIEKEPISEVGIYDLLPNYPNPFNPVTKIKYQIANNSNVKLVIYNVMGKEVDVLVNAKQNKGVYEVTWDAGNFPSGVYFYKLQAGDYTKTNKMVLIK